jgi:hypothetical protein
LENFIKKDFKSENQFLYLDRWVSKDTFRAYVYNNKHDSKLANSYKDYQELLASGLWFPEKPDFITDKSSKKKLKRQSNDSNS